MSLEAKVEALHSRLEEIAMRLREAEDQLAIQRLFIDLQNATDAHDGGRYAACFTEDGEWSGVTGKARGREAIAGHMERAWRPWASEDERTYHSIGDIAIDLDGDSAKASAQFWHIRLGAGGQPETFHFGRFEGDLARTPAGWRFRRRAGYLILPYVAPLHQLEG